MALNTSDVSAASVSSMSSGAVAPGAKEASQRQAEFRALLHRVIHGDASPDAQAATATLKETDDSASVPIPAASSSNAQPEEGKTVLLHKQQPSSAFDSETIAPEETEATTLDEAKPEAPIPGDATIALTEATKNSSGRAGKPFSSIGAKAKVVSKHGGNNASQNCNAPAPMLEVKSSVELQVSANCSSGMQQPVPKDDASVALNITAAAGKVSAAAKNTAAPSLGQSVNQTSSDPTSEAKVQTDAITPVSTQAESSQHESASHANETVSSVVPVEVHSGNDSASRAIVVAVAQEPSVTFRSSFAQETQRSFEAAGVQEDSKQLAVTESVAHAAPDVPIRHLEVQWKDAGLGDLSVRAEMRDGVLHASVTGTHASAFVNPSALHQFLEDNRVAVHGLQVESTGNSLKTTGTQAFSGDASGSNSTTAQRDGSQSSSQNRSFHQGSETSQDAAAEPDEMPASVLYSSSSAAAWSAPEGNRLSIHI